MQRVSAFLPSWDRRYSATTRNAGVVGWSNRASTPNGLVRINTIGASNDAQRIQREAFWPATLDLECDKAARILKAFCVDGYLAPADEDTPPSPSSTVPEKPAMVPKKIPKRIIQNAAGIAVFTCMRSGFWMTGSGGSGILIARKSDGTWSPPSGIMLHTPTLSFIIGVDVYDCVLVISDLAALESVTKPGVTLGEDVDLQTGQSVLLDSDETEVNRRELGNTVLTYMKARGQHQSVNLDGCILAERCNENERFYSVDVTQMDILAGDVTRDVLEATALLEVIKMAEGRSDFNQAVIDKIPAEPAPGDNMPTSPKSTPVSPLPVFGFPKVDDPDPFGVLALEMAGLEIREAGSKIRPTSSLFDLNQNSRNSVFAKLSRQSMDTFVSRSNRGSYMSMRTIKSQVTDVGTQTDVGNTPETTPSPGLSDAGNGRGSPVQIPEIKENAEVDYTEVDETPIRHLSQGYSADADLAISPTTMTEQYENSLDDADNDEQEDDGDGTNDADDEDAVEDDEEEPVVFEVAAVQPARTQAVASRVIHARGNVVTIAKRVPPPVPKRSPARMSRINEAQTGGVADDASIDAATDAADVCSPSQQSFSEADLTTGGDREQVAAINSEVVDTESTERGSIAEAQHKVLKTQTSEAAEAEAATEESDVEQSEREDIGVAAEDSKDSDAEQSKLEAVEAAIEEADVEQSESEDIGPAVEDSDAEQSELEEFEVAAKGSDAEQSKLEAVDAATEAAAEATTEDSDAEQSEIEDFEAAAEQSDTEQSKLEAVETVTEAATEESDTEQSEFEDFEAAAEESDAEQSELEHFESATEESDVEQPKREGVETAEEDEVESGDEDSGDKEADTELPKQIDEALLNEPHQEQTENSESASNKKHTSSIYTGLTEDRWSFGGSSPTTPTSERRFSIVEDTTAQDTPKKPAKETEKAEAHEVFSPLREVKTATQSPIAATF